MEESPESENFLPDSLTSVTYRFPESADGSWWLGKKRNGAVGKIVGEDLHGPPGMGAGSPEAALSGPSHIRLWFSLLGTT